MKKLSLILICLFLSFQSHGWELMGMSDNGNTFFIDRIKRSGNIVHFWSLTNVTDGTSDMFRYRVECISEKMSVIKWIKFSEYFGKGEKLHELGYDGKDMYPPPGTILLEYYNRVCS